MLSLLAASGEAANHIYWSELGMVPGIPIGSFTLRFYSLAYLIGVIFAYWHVSKMIKAPGAPMAQRHVDDLFFYCTLGVILGGRLGYATFYDQSLWTDFSSDSFVKWRLLELWSGGMSFHGGLLGVFAAMCWISWRDKLEVMRVIDYVSVSVPMGMLLGRLANFNNGELYGRVTDVSWAMIFPTDPQQLPRHPSQLYQAGLEGLALLIILMLLFWKTKARYRPGLLAGVFTLGMGIARFVNEFFREPDSQLRELAQNTGLSMGQWLTIPLILIGLIVVILALRKGPVGTGAASNPATT
ncbi:MAG: prolipoprotein diacylglyceryl transferase [Pseudomonadota bacterium]